jgi:L-cysteine desulfidase
VQKKELIKQLAKNREVMNAMNCTDPKKLATDVHVAACAKEGSLTWSEFLDFFFLKNATFADRIDANDWWNKIDENGKSI